MINNDIFVISAEVFQTFVGIVDGLSINNHEYIHFVNSHPENSHPGNSHQSNTPLVNSPGKFPSYYQGLTEFKFQLHSICGSFHGCVHPQGKFPPIKLPPWWSPPKNSHPENSHLEYYHPFPSGIFTPMKSDLLRCINKIF